MATTANGQLQLKSVQGEVTPEEWKARVDLAACYRLMAMYDMSDMIANHISARVPGEENSFLINAFGLLYEEITASSLVKINTAGDILWKPDFGDLDYGINRAGYVIHSAVHEANHEVDCVIHTHTWPGMAVSSLACGLLPLTQTAMRFVNIPAHDYEGVVLDESEKQSLLRDLGDHNAMVLRNHGLLTIGRTVAEAFNAMHRLELSCKAQLAAMACNSPLQPVPQHVLDATFVNYQPKTRRAFGVLEWPALLRKLDRVDPSYKH